MKEVIVNLSSIRVDLTDAEYIQVMQKHHIPDSVFVKVVATIAEQRGHIVESVEED